MVCVVTAQMLGDLASCAYFSLPYCFFCLAGQRIEALFATNLSISSDGRISVESNSKQEFLRFELNKFNIRPIEFAAEFGHGRNIMQPSEPVIKSLTKRALVNLRCFCSSFFH